MRSLPATTRVAIATLIIRYREARTHARRTRERLGGGHPAAIAADQRQTEMWNALHGVRSHVWDEVEGRRVTIGDAHAFVAFAAHAGRVREAAHQRSLPAKAA